MSRETLAKLREKMEPRWTEEQSARVRAGIARRGRRLRLAHRSLFVALPAVLVACAIFYYPRAVLRWGPGGQSGLSAQGASTVNASASALAPVASPPSSTPSSTQALGATVTLINAETELVPEPNGGGRAFALERGGARFFVAHDEVHPFRVRVGPMIIEDLGTVFTVERRERSVEVAVDEGRVRVRVSGLTADPVELGPGDRRTFDIDGASRADAGGEPASSVAASSHKEMPLGPPPSRQASVEAWRPLAESGRYREAYEFLRQAGRGVVRDEAGDLLLAADAARLSGHPADAVPYLGQMLKSHPSDPRAGLAAFTLGRVELEELGHPAEAAAAFERVRRDGGPLAEDALAREVEACSRAGDTARARSLALEYNRLYPHGRRRHVVAKFGLLE